MLQRKGGLVSLYVFIMDAAVLAVSYGIGLFLYESFFERESANSPDTLLLVFLALFILAVFFNSNRQYLRRSKAEELLAVIKSTFMFLMILVLLVFLTHMYTIMSRMVLAFTLAFFLPADFLARLVFKRVLNKNRSRGTRRMLLVTESASAEQVVRSVNYNSDTYGEIQAVALIDADRVGESIEGVRIVATLDRVFEYTVKDVVDEVFIYLPYEKSDLIARLVNEFESMGVIVHVAAREFEGVSDYVRTASNVANYPVTTFAQNVQDSEKMVVKRIIDIAGGIVGSVFTILLTIILGPVIYLESPGPIFFKQKRVGLNGRYFYMYKFRSMYKDAEARKAELMKKNEMNGLMFKITDDPRITKVGKFIRATSLDEFPQFFNILKGDMSLIGTRPPTVDEFVQYKDHHKRRLSMKPGLTGMWQVSGRSDITDFEEVVRLDCYYIDNWSLQLDLKIFLKTIVAVFRRKGSR